MNKLSLYRVAASYPPRRAPTRKERQKTLELAMGSLQKIFGTEAKQSGRGLNLRVSGSPAVLMAAIVNETLHPLKQRLMSDPDSVDDRYFLRLAALLALQWHKLIPAQRRLHMVSIEWAASAYAACALLEGSKVDRNYPPLHLLVMRAKTDAGFYGGDIGLWRWPVERRLAAGCVEVRAPQLVGKAYRLAKRAGYPVDVTLYPGVRPPHGL
jgi:hypothetical protein